MKSELANKIEFFLKDFGGPIRKNELARVFGKSERQIKQAVNECSGYILSGNFGYIHIDNANQAQLNEYLRRQYSQIRTTFNRLKQTKLRVQECRQLQFVEEAV